jgi:hypothetical protein
MAKTSPRKKAPMKAKKPARTEAAQKKRPAPAKPRTAAVPPRSESPAPVEAEVISAEIVADEPLASAPEAPPAPKALPAGEPVSSGPTLPFEIDPKRVEESLRKLQQEVVHWANKGRYTKVRFKFRGKQLLPDLPLAAVVAAEGLSFYWGGILRVLIANVVGRSVLQVEFVNDADKRVQAGREALLSGDVDQALVLFREALSMDRDNPGAHLNVGVALKLKGNREGALAAFEKALEKDPQGSVGAEAERLAAPLRPKDVAKSA